MWEKWNGSTSLRGEKKTIKIEESKRKVVHVFLIWILGIKSLQYLDNNRHIEKLEEKKFHLKMSIAGVQPRLIQGIRSGDGVGDLFIYKYLSKI